jgi:hypothetical protein
MLRPGVSPRDMGPFRLPVNELLVPFGLKRKFRATDTGLTVREKQVYDGSLT